MQGGPTAAGAVRLLARVGGRWGSSATPPDTPAPWRSAARKSNLQRAAELSRARQQVCTVPPHPSPLVSSSPSGGGHRHDAHNTNTSHRPKNRKKLPKRKRDAIKRRLGLQPAQGGSTTALPVPHSARVRQGSEAASRPQAGGSGADAMAGATDGGIAAYLRKNHGGQVRSQDSATNAHRLGLLRRDIRVLSDRGCELGIESNTALMTLFRRLGAPASAAEVFDTMLAKATAPAGGGRCAEAAFLRYLSDVTLASAILALVGAGRLPDVQRMMDLLPQRLGDTTSSGLPSALPGLFNAVLTMLVRTDAERGIRFYQILKARGVADTTSACLYVEVCPVAEVASVVRDAPRVTGLLLVAAVTRAGKRSFRDAEDVWLLAAGRIPKGGVTAPCYNAVINAARKHGEAGLMLEWSRRMAEANIASDAATYAICISGCAEASESPGDHMALLAEGMFQHATASGHGGNVRVCGAAAGLHAKHKEKHKMMLLKDHMHHEQVFVTTVIRDYLGVVGL